MLTRFFEVPPRDSCICFSKGDATGREPSARGKPRASGSLALRLRTVTTLDRVADRTGLPSGILIKQLKAKQLKAKQLGTAAMLIH